MKSIINYYILIFIPIILLSIFGRNHIIGDNVFVFLLFFYALIYHPFISGLRLLAGNKITKRQLWRTFIPGWNSKYFSFLFFDVKG